jgi:hypothetical protein
LPSANKKLQRLIRIPQPDLSDEERNYLIPHGRAKKCGGGIQVVVIKSDDSWLAVPQPFGTWRIGESQPLPGSSRRQLRHDVHYKLEAIFPKQPKVRTQLSPYELRTDSDAGIVALH